MNKQSTPQASIAGTITGTPHDNAKGSSRTEPNQLYIETNFDMAGLGWEFGGAKRVLVDLGHQGLVDLINDEFTLYQEVIVNGEMIQSNPEDEAIFQATKITAITPAIRGIYLEIKKLQQQCLWDPTTSRSDGTYDSLIKLQLLASRSQNDPINVWSIGKKISFTGRILELKEEGTPYEVLVDATDLADVYSDDVNPSWLADKNYVLTVRLGNYLPRAVVENLTEWQDITVVGELNHGSHELVAEKITITPGHKDPFSTIPKGSGIDKEGGMW